MVSRYCCTEYAVVVAVYDRWMDGLYLNGPCNSKVIHRQRRCRASAREHGEWEDTDRYATSVRVPYEEASKQVSTTKSPMEDKARQGNKM